MPPTATPAVAVVNVKTGYDVGERVPSFAMSLADGSTVTSDNLIDSGQPTFLFFFATF